MWILRDGPPKRIEPEPVIFSCPRFTMSSSNRDFETLVQPELAVLYRVAKRLAKDATEAEDLVGQTLFKAYRAWHSFDGAYLRSWLIRILRNEWLGSRRGSVQVDSLEDEGINEPAGDDVQSRVEANFDRESIAQAIDSLPEEYRLAVQLVDVEEMSYEEASRAMDIPVGTVRSRLFRGRERIRQKLSHTLFAGESRP